MTFTYNETLSDALSEIRFHIGDTIEGKGPRPDERNFSDEEMTAVLSKNSSAVNGAVVMLFRTLASEWAKYAISFEVGPRREELYRVSERYEQKVKEWQVLAGSIGVPFSSGLTRAGSRENSEFN